MEPAQLKPLLNSVSMIIAHSNKVQELNGDQFNVFSILKMERNENSTHSAFLCELLNPKGTHLKGPVFLELFLKTIGNQSLDIKSANVKAEYSIGWRDDDAKTGGRIDIYISDGNGTSICIENKIYAGDQFAQLERYFNHNIKRNSIYYLNLFGHEPADSSKGALISGTDFNIISYKHEILEWLQLCSKEAVYTPILRETIRQYINLIKKLTFTMDTQPNNDLLNVMVQHLEASSYIAANYEHARLAFCDKIRKSVVAELADHIGHAFEVTIGDPIDKKHLAQIWVKSKAHQNLQFAIEAFNGYSNYEEGDLFIGIFDPDEVLIMYAKQADLELFAKFWINPTKFTRFEGYTVHLNNKETLFELTGSQSFTGKFVEHIVREAIAYISLETKAIEHYLASQQ